MSHAALGRGERLGSPGREETERNATYSSCSYPHPANRPTGGGPGRKTHDFTVPLVCQSTYVDRELDACLGHIPTLFALLHSILGRLNPPRIDEGELPVLQTQIRVYICPVDR